VCKCEVVLFPKTLEQFGHLMEIDKVIFVRGKVDCKRETPNLLCEELYAIEDVTDKLAARVWIRLAGLDITEEKIHKLAALCRSHRGKSPVQLSVQTTGGWRIAAVADKTFNVRADLDFCRKIEAVVGRGNVELMRN